MGAMTSTGRLISGVYALGDTYAGVTPARQVGDRSRNWANVPKNKRPPAGTVARSIHPLAHTFECDVMAGSGVKVVPHEVLPEASVWKLLGVKKGKK